MKKWMKRTLLAVAVLVLIPILGIFIASKPLPQGVEGVEAEALANKMRTAIDQAAWDTTGAISWTFAGIHDFLWDREREFSRVSWGNNVVFVNHDNQKGVAFVNGQQVDGSQSDELVATAWSYFCNDSFWLNPISKVFDPGTKRTLIDLENGEKGLLITYTSGGVTPGDSYLWLVDENGLAKEWKMWVQIIPVGGVSTSWEGWKTLSTGAKVSTIHKGAFGLTLELTNIKAGRKLSDLESGNDPFAVLE